MEYGKKILEFRARNNLSQSKLAELFDVSSLMIYNYEAGKCKPHPKNKIKFENIMKKWEERQNVQM